MTEPVGKIDSVHKVRTSLTVLKKSWARSVAVLGACICCNEHEGHVDEELFDAVMEELLTSQDIILDCLQYVDRDDPPF